MGARDVMKNYHANCKWEQEQERRRRERMAKRDAALKAADIAYAKAAGNPPSRYSYSTKHELRVEHRGRC